MALATAALLLFSPQVIAGKRIFMGTSGKDNITGNAGDNKIYGGRSADSLNGVGGNDLINGGSGRDALVGGGENDLMHGDEAKDRLYGQTGDDVLWAGTAGDLGAYGFKNGKSPAVPAQARRRRSGHRGGPWPRHRA